MPLVYNAEQDNFSTILDPASDTGKIDYYVSASDKMNRTFSLPSEAPAETYSVTIGPDTIAPEINHVPIPYLVSNGESMLVSAKVDDNLGIDTVYVEFLINNVPQQSFGLTLDSANVYKGFFNIDANFLNDGDEVKYRIIATDSSVKRNKTSSPADDYYKFKAEKIFEPISYYFNDFNILNNDFVLSDFRIYLAKNFKDKSLHSPHPYPSTGDNNSNYSFTTVLKHPIILKQNGTMSFDEVVLVEPGEVLSKFGDENFWDYVIVEGSKDHGRTWLPLASGYDSGAYPLWKNSYNKEFDYNDLSLAVGTPDWFIKREINLLENGNFEANDTILVRFRLFSDPHANGWGWAIDNLRIQSPTSATSTILSPGNISVYPNPFNDIINVNLQVNKNIEELAVEIFNLYGQKISSVKNRNVFGEITIKTDLSNLSNGMYFVVVKENGKQVNSQKIIKN
jgi:hypothetical protein